LGAGGRAFKSPRPDQQNQADAGHFSRPASRTDARGIVTTYAYDELDQITSKSYSDNVTPAVTYNYWINRPFKGWLQQVQSSASMYNYSGYDGLGRISDATQTTNSQAFPFHMTYRLNDALKTMKYPSNRVVTTGYDNFGRAITLSGQIGSNPVTNYVTASSFATTGAPTSRTLGNLLVETTAYNARLQPTQIQLGALMRLGFAYGTTQNNGNVQTQTITRGAQTWTQTYGYTDGVNRLTSASETGAGSWSQTYGYDGRGNRWVSASQLLPSLTNEVPTGSSWYLASNQISSPSGAWTYDAAGNLQAMSGMPGRSFDYDAENRMKTAVVAGATTTYAYDGDGRRVSKTWNGQTTTFVYDPFGNLAAEFGGPAGSPGTQFVTTDHLGSTRLVTDSLGAAVKCYDYLPFGEEIGNGTAGRTASCFGSGSYPVTGGATNVEFTSKERDAETGLDYFLARYYSGAQGRFTSPDKPFADQTPSDPQSWNLYSYTRNNPLRYVDPSGRCSVRTEGGAATDDPGEPCVSKGDSSITVSGKSDGATEYFDGIGRMIGFQPNPNDGIKNVDYQLLIPLGAVRAALGLIGSSSAEVLIQGPFGAVSRSAIQAAAAGGGGTVTVVTRLTSAPQAGRALSTAVQGAEALTDAARSGGQLYSAQIPKALISALESAGLVQRSTTSMGGTVGTELRFLPNATEFITKYFKPVQ
jgi:RHS repeat-associated protein